MLLALFCQPAQPYAFLHPSTCKPFSVPTFCNYFKKHLKRMSGMDISPGKLRCVAVCRRVFTCHQHGKTRHAQTLNMRDGCTGTYL